MGDYETLKAMVEAQLAERFAQSEPLPQQKLVDAVKYSLLAGGKRLRPVLVLAFCQALGGDAEAALPVACAVEMLHTYSLIHDDLPCMDNDDLRRGKPTNHKVFGECTAVLAGDALQAEAFGCILRSGLPAEVRAACALALADAAGINGICGGQQIDMESDQRALSETELMNMQSAKTASLIICACKMGAIVGGADAGQLEAAVCYGAALGRAFQIRDDMLDEMSDPAMLGKSIGKDAKNGKTTYMTLLGVERCEELVQKLTDEAKLSIAAFPRHELLTALADKLCERKN